MREIKFRVWDKELNIMLTHDSYSDIVISKDYEGVADEIFSLDDFNTSEIGRFYEGLEYITEADRLDVMQFTGLHDRNGKEIYEGDIVTYIDYDGNYEYSYTNKGVVEYDESGAFYYFTNRYEIGMLDMDYSQIEVIGNIHENPELLQ